MIGTPASPLAAGVDVRTNGAIELKDNATVCGDVTPGPGKTVTGASPARLPCPGTSRGAATSQLVFDDPAADHAAAWTTNSNSRLGCGGGPTKDVCLQTRATSKVGREQARADRRERRRADAERRRLLALPPQSEEQLAPVHRGPPRRQPDQVLLQRALAGVPRHDREHHDRERLGHHEQQHRPDVAAVLRPRLVDH